jgi:hypothetical protein
MQRRRQFFDQAIPLKPAASEVLRTFDLVREESHSTLTAASKIEEAVWHG